MESNEKKKKVKVSNIVLDVLCVILFVFTAYGIVLKFTNNSIYLFGTRNDVVLTDSMSYKNEDPKVQEFLEGHDDQLKIGYLTFSEKVTDNTKLELYDIVIFKNRETGLETIHRIVDIKSGVYYADGKDRYLIRADTANYDSNDGLYRQEEIVARYKWSIPFIGHIYRFITSIYGLILAIGLIVIMLLYQFLYENYVNKKPIEQTNSKEENNKNE